MAATGEADQTVPQERCVLAHKSAQSALLQQQPATSCVPCSTRTASRLVQISMNRREHSYEHRRAQIAFPSLAVQQVISEQAILTPTSLLVLPSPALRLAIPAVYNPFGEEERLLFKFGSSADLQRWNVFSDSQYGGHSAAALKLSTEHKVRRWPAAVKLLNAQDLRAP